MVAIHFTAFSANYKMKVGIINGLQNSKVKCFFKLVELQCFRTYYPMDRDPRTSYQSNISQWFVRLMVDFMAIETLLRPQAGIQVHWFA